MTRLPALLLAATLSFGPPVAAFAQAITEPDKAAIQSRVDAFDAVMRAGQMGNTIDFVPPAMLDVMAAKFDITADQLREATKAQMGAMTDQVRIDDFAMDLGSATYAVTPDGKVGYALIPTTTVMTVEGGGKMKGSSQTLALQDGGTWYLMRIDDASQADILRETYPAFEGVEFPEGSIEAIQ